MPYPIIRRHAEPGVPILAPPMIEAAASAIVDPRPATRLWLIAGFGGRLLFRGANRVPRNVDKLFSHLHFSNSRQRGKQQKQRHNSGQNSAITAAEQRISARRQRASGGQVAYRGRRISHYHKLLFCQEHNEYMVTNVLCLPPSPYPACPSAACQGEAPSATTPVGMMASVLLPGACCAPSAPAWAALRSNPSEEGEVRLGTGKAARFGFLRLPSVAAAQINIGSLGGDDPIAGAQLPSRLEPSELR